MKLLVNDRVVPTSAEDGDTLDALLESLRKRGEFPSDEAVVTLKVNGETLGAEELESRAAASLQEIGELAVETASIDEYAQQMAADVACVLEVLLEATREVGRRFREGPPTEANAHLFRLLDAIQHFLGCLYAVQNTRALENEPLDAKEQPIEAVLNSLQTIQRSQEAQDWGALAGNLEYGLRPALEGFADAVEAIR